MAGSIIRAEEDIFDLSRFELGDFKDDYNRVSAAERYLDAHSNVLGQTHLREATNPVRIYGNWLERPSVNSHGEVELWMPTPDYQNRRHGRPFRSLDKLPEGVVLGIDTKQVIDHQRFLHRPPSALGLGAVKVYGNVRSNYDLLEGERRHIPGRGFRFIEIGAIYYSDVGNTWQLGVFGKGFNRFTTAEK